MTFTEYCAQNNIKLLPDDLKFIRKCLGRIPKGSQAAITRRYVEIWCVGMFKCDNVIKSDNSGRRAANIYLREMMDHGYDG